VLLASLFNFCTALLAFLIVLSAFCTLFMLLFDSGILRFFLFGEICRQSFVYFIFAAKLKNLTCRNQTLAN